MAVAAAAAPFAAVSAVVAAVAAVAEAAAPAAIKAWGDAVTAGRAGVQRSWSRLRPWWRAAGVTVASGSPDAGLSAPMSAISSDTETGSATGSATTVVVAVFAVGGRLGGSLGRGLARLRRLRLVAVHLGPPGGVVAPLERALVRRVLSGGTDTSCPSRLGPSAVAVRAWC